MRFFEKTWLPRPLRSVIPRLKSPRGLSVCSFVLFFFLWSARFPTLIFQQGPDLDSSWLLGLQMASLEELQFGRDVLFTFGPLNYLFLPVYVNFNFWFLSVTFHIVIHTALVFLFWWLLRKNSFGWGAYTFVFSLLWFAFSAMANSIEYKCFLVCLGFLSSGILQEAPHAQRRLLLSIFGFALACVALIKFNALFLSFGIVGVYFAERYWRNQFLDASILFSSFIGSLFILWASNHQSISAFPNFIKNGFIISGAYSNSMQNNGSVLYLLLPILSILFLLSILIRGCKNHSPRFVSTIIICLALTFVMFKHGFIRNDHHLLHFLGPMVPMLLIVFLLFLKRFALVDKYLSIALPSLLVISLLIFDTAHIQPNFTRTYKQIEMAINFTFSENSRRQFKSETNSTIRHHFNLSQETLNTIGNNSVDVLPVDIALAHVYGMNWRPRPTLQSESVLNLVET